MARSASSSRRSWQRARSGSTSTASIQGLAARPARARDRHRLPREPHRELRRGRARRRAREPRVPAVGVARLEHLPLARARASAPRSCSASSSSSCSCASSSTRRASSSPSRRSASPTCSSRSALFLPAVDRQADDNQVPERASRRTFRSSGAVFDGNDILVLIVVPLVLDRARRLLPLERDRHRAAGQRRERRPRVAARHPRAPAAERRVGDRRRPRVRRACSCASA